MQRSIPLILLLENEENDEFYFHRALYACRIELEVRIIRSVNEARDYLNGCGKPEIEPVFACPV